MPQQTTLEAHSHPTVVDTFLPRSATDCLPASVPEGIVDIAAQAVDENLDAEGEMVVEADQEILIQGQAQSFEHTEDIPLGAVGLVTVHCHVPSIEEHTQEDVRNLEQLLNSQLQNGSAL